jgi:hypothetical protein
MSGGNARMNGIQGGNDKCRGINVIKIFVVGGLGTLWGEFTNISAAQPRPGCVDLRFSQTFLCEN